MDLYVQHTYVVHTFLHAKRFIAGGHINIIFVMKCPSWKLTCIEGEVWFSLENSDMVILCMI